MRSLRTSPAARPALVCAFLSLLPSVVTAEPQGPPGAAEASGLAAHVHPVQVGQDGRLAGPGGDLLTTRAADAHFVLVGEQHAAGDVARAITALYRTIEPLGYDAAAIETSPTIAALLEDKLRADDPDSLARFFREETPHVFTVPFYSWQEDGELLQAVVETHDGPGPALWGLDQEFIASGPLLLDALAADAITEIQRDAVEAMRTAAAENVMWVAAATDEDLDRLAAAFADGPETARELVELVRVSRRIYRPFSGQGGSVYLANRERENLMKTHFYRYFEAAEKALGRSPKVLVKLGANHLYRGLAGTRQLSMGSFVEDLGITRGVEAFYLLVDCLGGEVRTPTGETAPCTSLQLSASDALTPHLPETGWAVLDLASVRLDRKLTQELGEDWEDTLWRFDALLAVRDPKPATFFEGTMPELPF